ncbi:hypothetical protein HOG21_02830 [bacterium]|jgi:hypothetical protein|nr:hypothetical protein [bacterium]
MKKLSLDSSLYKKLHEIGNNIFENISSDVSLMNIATNMKKLVEITNRNIFESTGEEAYGRSVHYVVLDNINII